MENVSQAAQIMIDNLERNPAMKAMMLSRLVQMASEFSRDPDGSAREVVAYYKDKGEL